jgi:hypothetical protein
MNYGELSRSPTFVAEYSWKQARNGALFREIQVGMAHSCCFHLHQHLIISEIVVDIDLLVAERSPSFRDQKRLRNHFNEIRISTHKIL